MEGCDVDKMKISDKVSGSIEISDKNVKSRDTV